VLAPANITCAVCHPRTDRLGTRCQYKHARFITRTLSTPYHQQCSSASRRYSFVFPTIRRDASTFPRVCVSCVAHPDAYSLRGGRTKSGCGRDAFLQRRRRRGVCCSSLSLMQLNEISPVLDYVPVGLRMREYVSWHAYLQDTRGHTTRLFKVRTYTV
jgi:hypothetical protein